MKSELMCHQCGFAWGRGYVLIMPDGGQHLFCDTDCLQRWLEAGQVLSLEQLRQETAERAQGGEVKP